MRREKIEMTSTNNKRMYLLQSHVKYIIYYYSVIISRSTEEDDILAYHHHVQRMRKQQHTQHATMRMNFI